MPQDYWVSPISNGLLQKAGGTLKKILDIGRENKFSAFKDPNTYFPPDGWDFRVWLNHAVYIWNL